MRKLIMVFAMSLVAAACGGGESTSTLESLDSGATDTLAPSPTTGIADSAPTTTRPPTEPPATEEPVVAAPVELPDSDYPDVVVADLAGG